jgi:hypothetical protein
MPSTPQRAGWWRFPAPSVLVFTLLMGVFPWVEIGCEGKPKDFEAYNQPNPLTGKAPERKIGQNGKFVYATQNGYQTIWGGASPGPEIAEMQREAEKEAKEMAKKLGGDGKNVDVKVTKDTKTQKNDEEPDSAPLVAVFFALVVVGVGLGFALPPGRVRVFAFGGTVTLAILVLGTQAAIGFPVKNKWEEQTRKEKKQAKEAKDLFGVGMTLDGPKPYCRLTAWYLLTWPFLLVPVGLVATEEALVILSGSGRMVKPKRRGADDDDDEDEDDADRPRKKSRVKDEDEDEEVPPRKKRGRAGDDDEDDRKKTGVKKKSRTYHDD